MSRIRFFLQLGIGLLPAQTPRIDAVDRRFVIVLIGPPGSGKTTQSEFLKKTFGIPTLTSEDLARSHPEALTKYETNGIAAGTPQSNPALNDLVRDALTKVDLTKGVVLDGYPASKDQADQCTAMLRKLNLPAPIVIQLAVPDDVVRTRLKARGRADDTPAIVAQRLKDYHRELEMMRTYYPQANIWTVDGALPPEKVSQTIQSILKDEMPKRQ